MSRFYISDSSHPGSRIPVAEHRGSPRGVGSEVMNEAQAIARGRKLTATAPAGFFYRYVMVDFEGGSIYGANTIILTTQLLDQNDNDLTAGITPVDQNSTPHPNGDITFGNYNSHLNLLLWDLGVPKAARKVRFDCYQFAPGFGIYAPSTYYIRAGSTPACTDYVSALLSSVAATKVVTTSFE